MNIKRGRSLLSFSEVPVRSSSGGYFVRVGSGVREMLGPAVEVAAPSGRCGLIADERVASLWYEEVAASLRGRGIDVVPAFFPGRGDQQDPGKLECPDRCAHGRSPGARQLRCLGGRGG